MRETPAMGAETGKGHLDEVEFPGRQQDVDTTIELVSDSSDTGMKLPDASGNSAELVTAAEALRESEARLRLAVQASNIGLWDWDLITNLVYFSPEWKSQIGYADDELSDRFEEWQSRVHPDDLEPTLEKVRAVIANPQGQYGVEFRFRHKDGSYRWIYAQGDVLRDAAGKPTRMLGCHLDITERKRGERALLSLAAIVESSDDAIVSKDLRGIIVSWNAAAQRIFGYTEAEAVGQPITIIIPPELQNDELQFLKRLQAGEHIEHFETIRVTKQGKRVHVSLTISPISNSKGEVVGASKIARDITDRKRAEHSLHEARAELAHVTRALAMGELVGSIAHEVNQPLTGVVTNANFALREFGSGKPNLENVREAIAEIVEEGTRASAVISRIRGLLKKGAPENVELDINDVIQEVIVLVRNDAAQCHVQVQFDRASNLPRVPGDRVQLQQVLINLTMNGIEAMRTVTDRPRVLNIKSAKQAEGVLVLIQDSGIGLDPKLVDRIFEPFFTTKQQGIGIGLSISRSIIESHGGHLWAEPGAQGARFQFTLPSDWDSA
jgi:PAS domain S-box-containing protein